eukprot:549267-Pelagomonas_calceolata.AAC.2
MANCGKALHEARDENVVMVLFPTKYAIYYILTILAQLAGCPASSSSYLQVALLTASFLSIHLLIACLSNPSAYSVPLLSIHLLTAHLSYPSICLQRVFLIHPFAYSASLHACEVVQGIVTRFSIKEGQMSMNALPLHQMQSQLTCCLSLLHTFQAFPACIHTLCSAQIMSNSSLPQGCTSPRPSLLAFTIAVFCAGHVQFFLAARQLPDHRAAPSHYHAHRRGGQQVGSRARARDLLTDMAQHQGGARAVQRHVSTLMDMAQH